MEGVTGQECKKAPGGGGGPPPPQRQHAGAVRNLVLIRRVPFLPRILPRGLPMLKPIDCPTCKGTGTYTPDEQAKNLVRVVDFLLGATCLALVVGGLAHRYGANLAEALGVAGLAWLAVPVAIRVVRTLTARTP